MHRFIAAAAAIAFALTPALSDVPPPPEPISPIVQIDESCTGFIVAKDYIATAGHCIHALSGFKIKLSNGEEIGGQLAIFASPAMGVDDIAVVRATALPDHAGQLSLNCDYPPTVGTAVHMTGFPDPGDYTPKGFVTGITVWGRVAAPPSPWKTTWERPVVRINISSYGGFSGSPVMTDDGVVVGILVGSKPDQHDLAAMQPASRLCDFLGMDADA